MSIYNDLTGLRWLRSTLKVRAEALILGWILGPVKGGARKITA